MKKSVSILVLLVFCHFLRAESELSGTLKTKVDSLQSVINTTTDDTTKIQSLNALGALYSLALDNESALQYYKQSFQLAKSVDFKKGMISSLISTGNIYSGLGDYEKALSDFFNSITISEQIKDKGSIATNYNNIANIYVKQGFFQKALDFHFKALHLRQASNNEKGMAMSYANIGNVYKSQSDYEKALEFDLKALKTFEAIGDKVRISIILNNIGGIYLTQKYDDKALDYYFRALKIAEEADDKQQMARPYENIAVVYTEQKKYDKALEYLLKSLKINEERHYKEGLILNYINMADIYRGKGDYNKALDYLSNALKLASESGYKIGQVHSFIGLGEIYLEQKQFEKANYYLTQALQSAKETGLKEAVQQIYLKLSELSDKKGDVKSAFEYYKLYSDIKDSLINEESGKRVAEMNGKYDSEKKDKEIIKKDAEIAQRQVEAGKQTLQRKVLTASAVVLLLIVLFIYRGSLQRKKANKQLEILNKELEKLSIVASETDNGVIICGPQGQIEWINPGMTRLLGYTLEDLKSKGSTLEEVSANPAIKALIQKSMTEKKSTVYETLSVTKNGEKRWTQSTLTLILDGEENIKKIVVIDTDITERKTAENELKLKNEKIIDSITYAQLIQQSILIGEHEIQKLLPDSFIYFQPKDIVSGDFYWCSVVDEKIILAAVDCTGHGVAGAFMSIIGNTLLDQIVNEKQITRPSEILQLLHQGVNDALHKKSGTEMSDDGMDIALCCIDYKNNLLHFAGARNPLYIVMNGELTIVNADRLTIGSRAVGRKQSVELKYTNHSLALEKGMNIYLFTDGYADQFGGIERKRMGSGKFKELVSINYQLEMRHQKELLLTQQNGWKGDQQQTDDILVIGVRI
jgi:PAS domain S-box-containing protein